jgi:hypothetical protein
MRRIGRRGRANPGDGSRGRGSLPGLLASLLDATPPPLPDPTPCYFRSPVSVMNATQRFTSASWKAENSVTPSPVGSNPMARNLS